ncbi:MAG: hypothetical protein NTW19_09335 [Planctomycetota bacterium]|nr:hypothetical protein [Planctomycetota bacterium]
MTHDPRHPAISARPPRRQRGVAMMLAMVAVTIVMVLTMGFVLAQQTTINISKNIQYHANARFIAETGLNMALDRINNDAAWRTTYSNGTWVNGASFGGGTLTLKGEDGTYSATTGVVTGDTNLNNNTTDSLTLTATGTYNGVSHTAHVTAAMSVSNDAGVLMIVPNAASLTTGETARQTLLQSWGFTVTALTASSSQSAYDTAVASLVAAQTYAVIYVASTCTATDIAAKLNAYNTGVVCEQGQLADDMKLTSADGTGITATTPTMTTVTLYPNSNLSAGGVAVTTSGQPMWSYGGTIATGATTMATAQGLSTPAMLAIETSGSLTSGTAAGRRLLLPWGGTAFDFSSLNSAGQTLLKRSLEWAAQSPAVGSTTSSTTGFPTAFTSKAKKIQTKQIATKVTLASSATLNSIAGYHYGTSGKKVRYAVYADSSGAPGALLVQTGTSGVTSSPSWVTISAPSTALAAGTYWLAMSTEDSSIYYYYSSSGGTNKVVTNAAVGSGFKSTWGTSSSSGVKRYSIYMNLTVSGGALVNNSGLAVSSTCTPVWMDEP